MHHDDSPTRERSTAEEDQIIEAAVLFHVLGIHPVQLTIAEIVRETTADSRTFREHDAVERAIRNLIGVGLFHRLSDVVAPTHAALYFRDLTSL